MHTFRQCSTRFVALVLTATSLACFAHADEPLRWKFKVGQKLSYNLGQEMWIAVILGGKKANESKDAKSPEIAWYQFKKDVGSKAQKPGDADGGKLFGEKFKDKTVRWTGLVDSVNEKPDKTYAVVVIMDPSEPDSPASKITLSAGEKISAQAKTLKKGEFVGFTAKLMKAATASTPHEAAASQIERRQALSTNMHQELEMTWDVQGVDDKSGEAVIRQKFDRVKMKMSSPLGGFEYDTKSEAAPSGLAATIAPMYKAITEGEFEIVMTARGEVKDVKIPEQVLTALKNSQNASTMGDIATPEGFKKMISQGALILPDKSPKVGDTWNSKVEMNNPMIGKQTIETTYRYAGTRDTNGVKFAVIDPQLKMDIETKPQPAAASGASQPQLQLKVKDQTSGGEVLFNINEGRLHSTTLKQHVTFEGNVAGQDMEQKIDQKIDVLVTPGSDKKPEDPIKPKTK